MSVRPTVIRCDARFFPFFYTDLWGLPQCCRAFAESSNGGYKLFYQLDGTLELKKQAQLIWKNTPWIGFKGAWRAIMQSDGNFVLYTAFAKSMDGFIYGKDPSWAIKPHIDYPGTYHLVLENDGRFVVYRTRYNGTAPIFDSSKDLPS